MNLDFFYDKVPEILIADDTIESLRMLSKALSSHGYDVRSVTNGTLALASAKEAQPDLILLDIRMPDQSGYEVCKKLKQNPKTQDIPVIFISALQESIDKIKAFEVGGVDYLSKPLYIAEVLARIKAQLAWRFSLKEIQKLNQLLEEKVQQRTAELNTSNQALKKEIEERKNIEQNLRESEAKFRQLSEHIQEVFWLTNYNAESGTVINVHYVSPAFEKVWGHTVESIYENPLQWVEAIHPDDRQRIATTFEQKVVDGSFDEEYRIIRPDGNIRWIHDRGFPIYNDHGVVYRIAGIAKDITKRKLMQEALEESEARLIHQTLHDSLTGLANRTYFMERLQLAVKQQQRHQNYCFAVLFIDLDDFKQINDNLGHFFGDQFLIEVSRILRKSVREVDCVARLGGDEFIILLQEVHDPEDVFEIVERIQEQLQSSVQLEDKNKKKIVPSASIGIFLDTGDSQDINEIVCNADKAMYAAKANGKGCYAVYDPNLMSQFPSR